MIEISFPSKTPDEAALMIKSLRTSLVRHGVADADIRIAKERADTMDLGTLLQIDVATYLHVAHLGLMGVACAKALWEICAPAHAPVRIKTAKGVVELSASEIESGRLQEVLRTIESDGRGESA
jgi:hypothetical protein